MWDLLSYTDLAETKHKVIVLVRIILGGGLYVMITDHEQSNLGRKWLIWFMLSYHSSISKEFGAGTQTGQ